MKFAHTCGYEVAEYIGTEPLHGLLMRSKDWLVLGRRPEPYSQPLYVCPRCKAGFLLHSQYIHPIEEENVYHVITSA